MRLHCHHPRGGRTRKRTPKRPAAYDSAAAWWGAEPSATLATTLSSQHKKRALNFLTKAQEAQRMAHAARDPKLRAIMEGLVEDWRILAEIALELYDAQLRREQEGSTEVEPPLSARGSA